MLFAPVSSPSRRATLSLHRSELLKRCISLSVAAWSTKWLDYKTLKRLIYAIPESGGAEGAGGGRGSAAGAGHADAEAAVEDIIRQMGE